MSTPLPSVDYLESLLRLLEGAPEERRYFHLTEPTEIPRKFSLRLEARKPVYDLKNLQQVAVAMMMDYALYQQDTHHATTLLKNTNRPNVMLLDVLKKYLPDYASLRSAVISDKNIALSFTDPMNMDAVSEIIANHDLEVQKDASTREDHSITRICQQGRELARVRQYSVIFPYSALYGQGKLEDGLRLATELITLVHEERLFREDIRKIHFDEYQPILHLLFPRMSEDQLTPFLEGVQEISLAGEVPTHPKFHLSRSSQRDGEQRYAYDKDELLPHLQYIVVNPEKQELYLRLGPVLDFELIEKFLESEEVHLSAPEKESVKWNYRIQKGGGNRWKRRHITTQRRDGYYFENGQRKKILEFQGDHIVKLSLQQEPKEFHRAANLCSKIYYQGLYYTGWLPTARLGSDITGAERQVIDALRPLEQMYNFFYWIGEETQTKRRPKPLEWIAHTMEQSKDASVTARVLAVLQEVEKEASPKQFHRLGNEEETQLRAHGWYALLQQLKGSFEGLVSLSN